MISLSEPYLIGNEKKYLNDCISSNWITSSGKYVKLFESKISSYTKSKYVVSCANGTSALHISLKVLGINEGDEVIVPTLTFVATINSIIYNKASPIFFDVDNYFSLDADKLKKFIKENTFKKNGNCINKKTNKKIFGLILVHVWGNAANIDKIKNICSKNNIKIIEDASESLGTFYTKGKYKNKHTGTIGSIGCLSFNGNKILTSAGGGAILTESAIVAKKFRYLINQAKDDKIMYTHNNIGFNLSLSNVHAAIGLAQIEKIDKFVKKKKQIRKWYKKLLSNYSLYELPEYSDNNCWLNVLNLKKMLTKTQLKKKVLKLLNKKIETRPIWQLNHTQKMFAKYQQYDIKNANRLYSKSLCLPSSISLKEYQIKYIVKNL